jgi:hypothetical protein
MTLQGEGYWLTFLLNWDRRAHDLVVRVRPPSGPRWAAVDLFTGEKLPASRRELARGVKVHIASWQVRAFAVAWEKEPAARLSRWQPVHPYAPLPD